MSQLIHMQRCQCVTQYVFVLCGHQESCEEQTQGCHPSGRNGYNEENRGESNVVKREETERASQVLKEKNV